MNRTWTTNSIMMLSSHSSSAALNALSKTIITMTVIKKTHILMLSYTRNMSWCCVDVWKERSGSCDVHLKSWAGLNLIHWGKMGLHHSFSTAAFISWLHINIIVTLGSEWWDSHKVSRKRWRNSKSIKCCVCKNFRLWCCAEHTHVGAPVAFG